MLTIDLGEATEVAVVDGSNLSQYLGDLMYGGTHGRGWKLIAVLEEEKLEHYNETVPNPAFNTSQGEYGSNVRVHQLQKAKKVKIHKFLLGKTRDSVLEELGQKLATAVSQAHTAEQGQRTYEAKLKELETKLAGAEAKVLKLDRESEESDRVLGKKQETLRSMELDIAKIRTAIGTDRMKEIIGR